MTASAVLGFKLGGDPSTVRELATWLREHVAAQGDAMSAAARWARDQLGPDLWWDTAAMTVYADFSVGARKAAEYADRVRELAQLVDDSADKLEYAIKVLADVPAQAERGQLEHTDEYVKPPSIDDPPASIGPVEGFEPEPITSTQSLADNKTRLYGARFAHYERCEQLVEAAAQILLDQMERLDQLKQGWQFPIFDASAFVSDEAGDLMTWFQGKYLEGVRTHGRHGVSFLLGAADEAAKDSPLWQAMLRDAAGEAKQVNRAATGVFWTGVARKVLKPAGPLIAVAATVYDIHSGYSARRAIFTNLSGFAGGGIAMAGAGDWQVAQCPPNELGPRRPRSPGRQTGLRQRAQRNGGRRSRASSSRSSGRWASGCSKRASMPEPSCRSAWHC